MNNLSGNFEKYTRRAQWRAEKDGLARYYAAHCRKLVENRMNGKRRHEIQRSFLRDPKLKRAAIIKSLKGRCGRDATYRRAEGLNLKSAQEHRIETYFKPKKSGGRRMICDLPSELTAKHHMIKSLLDAEFNRHPNMFGVKSFGREDAAQRIQELQRDGLTTLWQTDISDCYDSFNLQALYELPLPRDVIANSLDTRSDHFSFQAQNTTLNAMKGASPEMPYRAMPVNSMIQDNRNIGIQDYRVIGSSTYNNSGNTRGPRGLMQGSPASPGILAWHLNECLKTLPLNEDVQVIVCFDNLLIASRDEEANRMIRNTLAECLGRCSFGPLTLHTPEGADADGETHFLGYCHREDGERIGIGLTSRESLTSRLVRHEKNFEAQLVACPEQVDYEAECYELWKILLDFANGFPSITDINAEMAEFIETSSWIPQLSGSPLLIDTHLRLFSENGAVDRHVLHTNLSSRRRRRPT
ncbi:hypothetical protein ACFE33_04410 [Falsihalocynthiibacter sp. SS001]|uniref:hypothetical protein n=1 Tax=Falsihalocynthiibacter sp. SS001 TaxID=3349698 RepID=UPI0036D3191E